MKFPLGDEVRWCHCLTYTHFSLFTSLYFFVRHWFPSNIKHRYCVQWVKKPDGAYRPCSIRLDAHRQTCKRCNAINPNYNEQYKDRIVYTHWGSYPQNATSGKTLRFGQRYVNDLTDTKALVSRHCSRGSIISATLRPQRRYFNDVQVAMIWTALQMHRRIGASVTTLQWREHSFNNISLVKGLV